MYLLLTLYLIGVLVWFAYTKWVLEESYEASIVFGVFHPIAIAMLYLAITVALIVSPIWQIIARFMEKKETKNDN
jgi:hypothetical protein